jgi:putative transposase
LQEIWLAETKNDALTALAAFVETYQIKYETAADCLTKDRDALLAFYDSTTSLPSTGSTYERRTPIESTFATVRHRTIRSNGCLSNKTAAVFNSPRRRARRCTRPNCR